MEEDIPPASKCDACEKGHPYYNSNCRACLDRAMAHADWQYVLKQRRKEQEDEEG